MIIMPKNQNKLQWDYKEETVLLRTGIISCRHQFWKIEGEDRQNIPSQRNIMEK